jgi:hypothetical protein
VRWLVVLLGVCISYLVRHSFDILRFAGADLEDLC